MPKRYGKDHSGDSGSGLHGFTEVGPRTMNSMGGCSWSGVQNNPYPNVRLDKEGKGSYQGVSFFVYPSRHKGKVTDWNLRIDDKRPVRGFSSRQSAINSAVQEISRMTGNAATGSRSRNTSSFTPSGRTARMMRRRNPIGQEYFIDPVKGTLFSAAQALKMLPKYPSSVKFALQMEAGEDPVAAGGVLAVAAAKSENSKTGDCYVTSSAQQSCPNGKNNVYRCPFLEGNGCYAEVANQGNWTRILNKTAEAAQADSLTVAKAEAAAIEKLAAYLNTYQGGPQKLLRLHIVGDAVTAEAAQLLSEAAKPFIRRNAQIPTLFSANQEGRLIGNGGRGDSKVWAYTHGWRSVPRSAWGDVSILASCETSEDLEEAYSRGYALSAVVKKYDNEHLWDSSKEPQRWKAYEKYGFIMLPCPNEAGGPKKAPGVEKCVTCGLCLKEKMLRDKRMVIAFETHGSRTKRIDEVLVQIGANL